MLKRRKFFSMSNENKDFTAKDAEMIRRGYIKENSDGSGNWIKKIELPTKLKELIKSHLEASKLDFEEVNPLSVDFSLTKERDKKEEHYYSLAYFKDNKEDLIIQTGKVVSTYP